MFKKEPHILSRNSLFNPSINPQKKLSLGDVSTWILPSKMPDGSGYFLYFKLNEHSALVEEGAKLIAEHIKQLDLKNPYFVTPEASTFALAHVLRTKYNIDGITIYKKKQINDIDPITIEYDTVTSNEKQKLSLGRQKIESLKGKDIFLLDSICTTGGTIVATYNLLIKAGIPSGSIIEATMLFNEGEPRNSITINEKTSLKLHSFSELPLIKEGEMQRPSYRQTWV